MNISKKSHQDLSLSFASLNLFVPRVTFLRKMYPLKTAALQNINVF